MRLFFAAWPPAAAAAALHAWGEAVRENAGGRVTPVDNIHLTLAFLGEGDLAKAIAAAQRVRASRHGLPVDAARYVKRNEMVWAGPRETPPALAALVHALHHELRREQFVLERRPFAAHVTLLRKAGMPKAIPPLPTVRWAVDEFLLIRSQMSSTGSTYHPVERFPLV